MRSNLKLKRQRITSTGEKQGDRPPEKWEIFSINRISRTASLYTNPSICGLKEEGEVGSTYFHPKATQSSRLLKCAKKKKIINGKKKTHQRREMTLRFEPAQKTWRKIKTVKKAFAVGYPPLKPFLGEIKVGCNHTQQPALPPQGQREARISSSALETTGV